MLYDFSRQDRHKTDCLKFDFAVERGYKKDALSFWVADMDFKTAPEILSALTDRVNHGIFGYTNIKPHYFEAVASWLKAQHGWKVRPDWLVETPGVVFAIATAIRALTKEGDGVLIQSPVYYPFSNSIRNSGRKIVSNPLVWKKENLRYEIDFADFEEKIKSEKVRLFLLCNPHNPGGRSWSREELLKMSQICLRHKVIVVSDEIHSDFIWGENHHTVTSSLSEEIAQNTITCTSPSKTFNLAGLQVSNIFIPNREIRAAFKSERDRTGYDEPSLLGLTACEAAYTKGLKWHEECKKVIEKNFDFALDFINKNGRNLVRAKKPDATYLLWLDCTALPYDDRELNRRIREEANVWLDSGNVFGKEGEMFERFNVATSRDYLEKGLEAFLSAVL